MLIIGITGGIGSGKSTVCECFKSLGTPIYTSDSRAKELMVSDKDLIASIKACFGDESYSNGELNRVYLANLVFNDTQKLAKLNSLVHPVVMQDFKLWCKAQKTAYVIMESAILIESGFYKQMNTCVGVVASLEQRVKRVIARDNCTENQVLNRIKMQLPDDKLTHFCDEIIFNDIEDNLMQQIEELDKVFRHGAGVKYT